MALPCEIGTNSVATMREFRGQRMYYYIKTQSICVHMHADARSQPQVSVLKHELPCFTFEAGSLHEPGAR